MRTGDGRGPEPYQPQPYFRDMERLLVYETAVHFLDTFRFLGGEFDIDLLPDESHQPGDPRRRLRADSGLVFERRERGHRRQSDQRQRARRRSRLENFGSKANARCSESPPTDVST